MAPKTRTARTGTISDDDTTYRVGSYLFVQKYIHDLTAWKQLSTADQEKVIGRSKADVIEMADEVKPANSHIALANVGDDFKIVQIICRSVICQPMKWERIFLPTPAPLRQYRKCWIICLSARQRATMIG